MSHHGQLQAPDWKTQAEFQKVGHGFVKMVHSLLGLYAYEFFISLDFEWDFITGKRRFRWPMIFYFANRYCLLAAMVGLIIALDTRTKINCSASYIFVQLTVAAAIGLASINLSIRTIAIWSSNKYIVGGLIIAILGQWSLILQGSQLRAMWWHKGGLGCIPFKVTNNKLLSAIFIYAMCFDLVVLLLTTYKLFVSSKSSGQPWSRVTQVIFVDGLNFFIVAFLANLTTTIFIFLQLNSFMSVMFSVPAAVFSTIVACRAVRRLKNTRTDYNAERSAPRVVAYSMGRCENCRIDRQSGVHIQTETSIHRDSIREIEYQPNAFEKSLSNSSSSDISLELIKEEPRARRLEVPLGYA